jgi:hypothetical protein
VEPDPLEKIKTMPKIAAPLALVAKGLLHCDCCHAPDPQYDYDTGNNIVLEAWVESGPRLAPPLILDRWWVVCGDCEALIRDRNFTGLLERVLAVHEERNGKHSEADALDRRRMFTHLYRALAETGMKPCFICDACKSVSYHPEDRRHRYCGKCHEFR